MRAPIPKNEAKRLEVLWQYEVLDTVPEQIFDDLTDLAARICEAPIALISLVDEDRQWFKSRVGLGATQTARDLSFCAHAILQDELFIIRDARHEPRFRHHPWVTRQPKMRFYAGAPLITPDGHALGTLCVMDKVPRTLTANQKQALRVLARLVVTQLELRRHSRELAEVRRKGERAQAQLARLHATIARLRRELRHNKVGTGATRSRARRLRSK